MAIAERVTMQKGEHTVTVFQVDARELRAQGYVPVGEIVAPPAINPDTAIRDALVQLHGPQSAPSPTPPRRKR